MKTAVLTSGNHLYLALEGSAYAAGAAGSASGSGAGITGRQNKPAATDAAWIYCGLIASLDVEHINEEQEVRAPLPGALRRYDSVPTRRDVDFTVTLGDISRLTFALLYGTDHSLLQDATVQYNPLEGDPIRGWAKFQQYEQYDDAFNVVEVYSKWSMAGPVTFGGEDVIRPQWKIITLHSTLNTGRLYGLLV